MVRTRLALAGFFLGAGFYCLVSCVSSGKEGSGRRFFLLADHLVYKSPVIREKDYTVWGASPVVDEGGKVHLFAARWPQRGVDPAWRRFSEIAHYVADSPDGPFRFVGVVVKGSGRKGEWDAFAPSNPEVKRFGDTYALVYIANSDYHQPPHPRNQSIGMMTAKSPYGPWTKVGENGRILSGREVPFAKGAQVVNPALLKVGKRFFLYFKTARRERGKWRTVFGLAVADRLEGPYVPRPEPVTPGGVVIEDASAFLWKGKVCLLTTDNKGLVTGVRGGLVLWVSEDGLHFPREWASLAMRTFPYYLPDYDRRKVKRVYGRRPKAERPKVLVLDGKPAYLYVASGWIYDGSPRCENHLFAFDLPEGASPLP